MAIQLYYVSGSPPSWRVWLALEHKQLPYAIQTLSAGAGDLKAPAYLALNPRGKVPTIVDDGFVLYESMAILEYLDQQYPDSGAPLFPRDAKAAAVVRRLVAEAESYFYPATHRLMTQTLFRPKMDGDLGIIAAAREQMKGELAYFERLLTGDFLAGSLSAADFTLYPQVAIARRIERRQPEHGVAEYLGPRLLAWMARIEALPFFDKTYPPHWR